VIIYLALYISGEKWSYALLKLLTHCDVLVKEIWCWGINKDMIKIFVRPIFLSFLFLWVVSGIAFSAPAERIVSLAPNLTEILFDLGLGDHIVAVTNFCDYPPEAHAKRKIGGFSNPSLEAIIAAKPDMVIMTEDGNPPEIFDRLKKMRINTYVFKAKRLHELPQGLRDLGTFLGVRQQAVEQAKKIERVIHRCKREMKSTVPHRFKKAIFIIQPEPLIVAGSGTVIDDAFLLVGLQNIAAGSSKRYPKFSMEELVRRSPDIIFIGRGKMTGKSAENLIKRLSSLEAVKKHDVYYTSESLYRLTPRVVYGIEEIAAYIGKHRTK